MSARGTLHVGTSGYHYDEWKGLCYPEGTPKSRWFDCYAGYFDTVEVNNTFYGLPAESTFDAWRERAPDGFVYAIKADREITHRRRLRNVGEPLKALVVRAERLGDHLGPFLLQLPPRWEMTADRLGRLDRLLAQAPGVHRWAVEPREPSWRCEALREVLRSHGAALVLHDLPGGELPGAESNDGELTTDWTYLRFHGDDYAGAYGEARLAPIAERISEWLALGLDLYAYFNNTKDGSAVDDARRLRELVLSIPSSPRS